MEKLYLVTENDNIVTRYSPEDMRRIYYLVHNKRINAFNWLSKSEVIKSIKKGSIINAELKGNKIVLKMESFELSVVDTDEKYDELVNFAKMQIELYSSQDDENYFGNDLFEYMAKKENKKTYMNVTYIIKRNNKIFGIYIEENFYGVPLFFDLYVDGGIYEDEGIAKRICMNLIVNKKRNACFYFEYLYPLEDYIIDGFCLQKYDSSIKKEKRYYHHNLRNIFMKGNNEYYIRDAIERKYYPKNINFSKITYFCMTSIELQQYLRKKQMSPGYDCCWGESYVTPVEVGFTYFEYNDVFNNKDKKYIIAKYNDLIVGVIKFGDYYNHQSIPYIDVRYGFREKGIATNMVKHLNKFLKTEPVLILTQESEMGKKCNIAKVFKKYITTTKVYTYDEANMPENRHLY